MGRNNGVHKRIKCHLYYLLKSAVHYSVNTVHPTVAKIWEWVSIIFRTMVPFRKAKIILKYLVKIERVKPTHYPRTLNGLTTLYDELNDLLPLMPITLYSLQNSFPFCRELKEGKNEFARGYICFLIYFPLLSDRQHHFQ